MLGDYALSNMTYAKEDKKYKSICNDNENHFKDFKEFIPNLCFLFTYFFFSFNHRIRISCTKTPAA